MKLCWKTLLLSITAILLFVAGCVPTAQQTPAVENTPAVRETTPANVPTEPGDVNSGPGKVPGGPGISFEENLAINPPPVQNLSAQAQAGGILLTWEAPPTVTLPHRWEDAVLGYKVYRRTADTRLAFLADTPDTQYMDETAEPGVEYFYTITALHAHNVESTRPDVVSAVR